MRNLMFRNNNISKNGHTTGRLLQKSLFGSQTCRKFGCDDVIFVCKGLTRGAEHSFPPPFHTFVSTLKQRRDAGGRGLTGSTQWIQHGEMTIIIIIESLADVNMILF